MKDRTGGLGKFLNEVTQTSDKSGYNQSEEQIVYLDIDLLESNPKNFYGLRDVDALAGLIAVSHLVEPLTVSEKGDGKYTIISGHRRRAAVEKLLEEGVYSERKLPCIIKSRGRIKIEQENGEIIDFDEDAVEMLNLIASNRGQREERTIEEKLQEVKYLEGFAKAIYNQKNKGQRGRFRNFFAEEILNISKSQLQRINSMEKLTDKVKQAVDDKKLSETAAMEMATMSPAEQDACLEKILTGEIKGRVRDIQKFKLRKEEEIEGITIEEMLRENADVAKNAHLKKYLATSEKSPVSKIMDVPEEFDDPQKEAEEWFFQEGIALYEAIYEEAKRLSEEEANELKAAQWGIRASVAHYNIEKMKRNHS